LTFRIYRIYNNYVKIEFDPAKREWTLRERGLDLAKADRIFDDFRLTDEDQREDYGEVRFVTLGALAGAIVVCVCTQRGEARRIISFGKHGKMSETPTTPTGYDPDDPGSGGYDPDDAPEFTPEMAARAQIAVGNRIIREADPPLASRRGRPPKSEADRKELVSLRLSRDVVTWLRASGPGWQTRIEEMLRAQMASHPAE
jgi:hypothetical protein